MAAAHQLSFLISYLAAKPSEGHPHDLVFLPSQVKAVDRLPAASSR
jgi:hypothetical protein